MMALADWDRRLIAPERALWLAGDWAVYFTAEVSNLSQFAPEGGGPPQRDQIQINMRCRQCGQSITLLAAEPDLTAARVEGGDTTAGDLISDVLRHQVMAHDQPLSGGKSDG
jgi:hypothetical protein